ncbi:hypothetical protein [Ghiorsea bivora]|uniref:hypothetical protein n=1 Tax=Ghiorsea bivora TaxID=1485545 RepID=UPI000B214A46|nr:hypothetical protein [Ghiorsea bivora]
MKHIFIISIVTIMLMGCAANNYPPPKVYMLLDTSGTYTQELVKAQHVINFTLAKLNPGDTFTVARVDTASFSEKTLSPKSFDDRPSIVNRQKRQFREKN